MVPALLMLLIKWVISLVKTWSTVQVMSNFHPLFSSIRQAQKTHQAELFFHKLWSLRPQRDGELLPLPNDYFVKLN